MFIADFHIHSKYSRATSGDCEPEKLAFWARRKGLDLIGTGDFTHALWRAELREKLVPAGEGIYALPAGGPRFIVTGEISGIYKKNGRVRKVHNVIVLPSLEAADALSARLERIGNLHSDGRPILGLDSRDLLEITLTACPEAIFIPAHIWTPHFSLFGAYSGFDAIEECFGDLTPHIHALETGLSSDPPMNWRLSALDSYTLVSNSDAHSPGNLAREANIFSCEMGYSAIARALADPDNCGFGGTLEFFPEEGKYHYDGHRGCKTCLSPAETIALGGVCPVCGGRITLGVSHRVEELADRPAGFSPPNPRHFESLVPLPEIIAASMGVRTIGARVTERYEALLRELGSELYILRRAPLADIERIAGSLIAEGVRRLRDKRVSLSPGFDGEYGRVSLFQPGEAERFIGQLSLFGAAEPSGAEPKTGAKANFKPEASRAEEPEAKPKDSLNAAQSRAAESAAIVTIVTAGPGTGKTKTLVSRVERLIQGGAKPSGIVAVTFTNKAADELRARLEKSLGKGALRGLRVGTFHSIGLKTLKTSLTILAQEETEALLGGLGAKSPKEAARAVSLYKNGASAEKPELCDAYDARLKELGAMDYDDILLKALECAGSVTHLLADEFQDVSPVQYRLLRAWAKGGESLFVIGDPDQAIYGFRGAAADCFEWIERDFPQAEHIRLTENYRSSPEIIRMSSAVLGGGIEARRPGMAKPRLIKTSSAFDEAAFIAREAARLTGGLDMLSASGQTALSFSDIAVLFRANRQAEALEEAFVREGIPYTVIGREDCLSEPEAREAMAFLRSATGRPGKALAEFIREKGATPALERLLAISAGYASAADMLHALTLGQEGDIRRAGKVYAKNAVTLSTIHGAKGLEFPVVFVCGLGDGTLPSRRGDLEEERRLFYVAMTRARDELILCAYGKKSPLLEGISKTMYEETALARKPAVRQLRFTDK